MAEWLAVQRGTTGKRFIILSYDRTSSIAHRHSKTGRYDQANVCFFYDMLILSDEESSIFAIF